MKNLLFPYQCSGIKYRLYFGMETATMCRRLHTFRTRMRQDPSKHHAFFMKPALLDRKVLETERLKSVNCENECDFSIVRCIGKRLIYNRQQERIFAASVSVSLSCRLRSQN